MKWSLLELKALLATMLLSVVFSACGDSSTEKISQVTQGGVEIVATLKDLPDCTSEDEGSQVWIKNENAARLCVDNQWILLSEDVGDKKCSAVALPEANGFKIECDGDSIGVVWNGADGENGKDGDDGKKGENGKDGTDGKDGNDGKDWSGADLTDEADEDSIYALDDVSISGRSEKGPFLRGASVMAYELLNGRTLKQTGKIFNGEIDANDGTFNIKSVKLSSQYAIIRVKGYYRNEVTGNTSDNAIDLLSLTNLKGRSRTNVNLMTHLEFNRVSYLVAKKGLSVFMAKNQAEREILAAFNIDTTEISLNVKSEDLSIFGNSDGNAALLTISILLQGDRSTAELKALLSAISSDLEEDGSWDDSLTRADVAQWAMRASFGFENREAVFRKKIRGWNIDTLVPNFEKYLREFWTKEYNLGRCDENVGETKSGLNGSYFTCRDSANVRFWGPAADIEVDTVGWGHDFQNGATRNGQFNKTYVYVFEDGNWRRGTAMDSTFKVGGFACISGRDTTKSDDGRYYYCKENGNVGVDSAKREWAYAGAFYNDTYDNRKNCTEEKNGDLMKGLEHSENVYVCDYGDVDGDGVDGWEEASAVERVLGGCRSRQQDSVGFAESDYYTCLSGAWVVASEERRNAYGLKCTKDGALDTSRVDITKIYTCDSDTFRLSTDPYERFVGKGCVSYLEGKTAVAQNKTIWTCSAGKWIWDSQAVAGSMTDSRDNAVYKTTAIDTMTWLAENLKLAYNEGSAQSYCYGDDEDNCTIYGRLYNWAAAMDSAAVYSTDGKKCGYNMSCEAKQPARGICPEGWHLPSDSDWNALFDAVGSYRVAGIKLKSKTMWSKEDDCGTDDFGFSVLPSGYYSVVIRPAFTETGYATSADYVRMGYESYFWSSNEFNDSEAFYAVFKGSENYIYTSLHNAKSNAMPIRCVKDSE